MALTNIFKPRQELDYDKLYNDDMSQIAFVDELQKFDKDYLDRQQRIIRNKTGLDLGLSALSLYSNLSAPLPDKSPAVNYTAPETQFPMNTYQGIVNDQKGSLMSTARNINRLYGSQNMMNALPGAISQANQKSNQSLATQYNQWLTNQATVEADVVNKNSQARALSDAKYMQDVAKDNVARSQATSAMLSQMSNVGYTGANRLADIKNMRTANSVFYKTAKDLALNNDSLLFWNYLGMGNNLPEIGTRDEEVTASEYGKTDSQ